jgi:ferrochelatase
MKRGVLLLNMGGPNSIEEVELFLRNMFSDPRILPMHPVLRRMIGKRIVRKRLAEAQANYQQMGGRSPLGEITRSLAQKIEARLGSPTRPVMRYVPPFADEALEAFRRHEIEEIVAFPMYPHYSTTTTASSLDDLAHHMDMMRYRPKLTVVDPYYADEAYHRIQLARIRSALGDRDPGEYLLLFSAHGLPLRMIERGDPYRDQIEANVAALERMLAAEGITFAQTQLAYQSKVGNAAWLEPNLADVLRRPRRLRVLIVPLSFTIDNSETLFELDVEHRLIARKIGYEDYRVASCPNDGDDFADFIARTIDQIHV